MNPIQIECYLFSDVLDGLHEAQIIFGDYSELNFGSANRTLYTVDDLMGDLQTILDNDCDDDETVEGEFRLALERLATLPPFSYVDLEN